MREQNRHYFANEKGMKRANKAVITGLVMQKKKGIATYWTI